MAGLRSDQGVRRFSSLGPKNDVLSLDQRRGLHPRRQAQLLHGLARDDGVHLGASGELEHHFDIHRTGLDVAELAFEYVACTDFR